MHGQARAPKAFFVFAAALFLLSFGPVAFANHGEATGDRWHSDTGTVSVTRSSSVNNQSLRGFDPTVITGPNDLFPDTSRPCCLNNSTQFGNGLSAGSSRESISQNCVPPSADEPVVTPGGLGDFGTGNLNVTPESAPFPTITTKGCNPSVSGNVFQSEILFQQSFNGILSRPQTDTTACDSLGAPAGDRRCNEITFGFLQDVQDQGQIMDLTFIIRSITDSNGNLVGVAQGTVVQRQTEGSVSPACAGSFTFDETNGFVMTSGPLHEC